LEYYSEESLTIFSAKTGRPLIVAFEGWNDAGNAAGGAVKAIIDGYDLEPGFGIDGEQFYDHSVSRPTVEWTPEDGRQIRWPTSEIFFPANKTDGVHALHGIEPARLWPTFVATFLDEALAADITGIIVLGSMLADVPHTRPIEISLSSENQGVRSELGCERSQYEGPIGITSVFAYFAEQVGIPTLSLWASVPHYVHLAPSPKATLAIVERIKTITELTLDTTKLESEAAEWEENINEMAQGDEDMADYIRQLEEDRDTAASEDASGEAIAEEFEKFLRSNPDEANGTNPQ
jgi:hypothetical protein